MLRPDRIRSRMAVLGLTQAQLARIAGVSQQTIGRIVSGGASGSRFTHKIARGLQTTPAYLTGETDDSEADAPDPPTFSAEEIDWVELMRAIGNEDRRAILRLMRSIATSAASPSVHSKRLTYRGEG